MSFKIIEIYFRPLNALNEKSFAFANFNKNSFFSSFAATNHKTADRWRDVVPGRIIRWHWEAIHHRMRSRRRTGTKVSVIFHFRKAIPLLFIKIPSTIPSQGFFISTTPEIKNYIKLCSINHKTPYRFPSLMFQFAIEPQKFLCFLSEKDQFSFLNFPVTIVFNVPEAICWVLFYCFGKSLLFFLPDENFHRKKNMNNRPEFSFVFISKQFLQKYFFTRAAAEKSHIKSRTYCDCLLCYFKPSINIITDQRSKEFKQEFS